MRLSKLEAAARLGVTTATIDRRLQRGELKAEKEPHGTRYRVWVIFDDDPPAESHVETGVETAVNSPVQSPLRQEQQHVETGDTTAPPPAVAAAVEMALLKEQLRHAEDRANSLEDLTNHYRKLLTDSEWRYQEILQELRQSQQNVAALTRALPVPEAEPPEGNRDPTTIVVDQEPTPRPRRRWWPFTKG